MLLECTHACMHVQMTCVCVYNKFCLSLSVIQIYILHEASICSVRVKVWTKLLGFVTLMSLIASFLGLHSHLNSKKQ